MLQQSIIYKSDSIIISNNYNDAKNPDQLVGVFIVVIFSCRGNKNNAKADAVMIGNIIRIAHCAKLYHICEQKSKIFILAAE